MGQSWKVINLDKRVSFGVWGKLGEFLFGLPDGLAKSIGGSIPDRDTMLLPFRPGEVSEEGGEDCPPVRFSKPATQSTALLLSLPVELIHEVYLELELFADVMCFSVTCQTLWAIGGDHVYRHIAPRAAPYSWAGDRVLCVGEYLQNGHIPAGLLTSKEQDELLWDGLKVVTLFHYPFEEISPRGFQEYDVCQGDFSKRLGYGKERRILCKLCNFDGLEASPRPPVVLRNLSQQQYVCESALLALKAKHAASGRYLGRQLAHVGLGEILMTRICLSSDPSASLAWNGAINHRAWAGDRFDTVDEEEFLGGDIGGAWKNVGGEVLKDLEAIWAAEFGF